MGFKVDDPPKIAGRYTFINVYFNVIEELINYFNPLNIGIVIDSDTETLLKKRNELLCKQNLYAETFKNHQCSEKPSFEEWLNW